MEQAEDSHQAEKNDWACFAAQQAAEMAVKALHQFHKQDAWGHVIRRLMLDLTGHLDFPKDLLDKSQVLDNYYIPPRYPNSHAEGAPYEHYNSMQSGDAIKYAGEILQFVRTKMA